jgi:hypothetical protein
MLCCSSPSLCVFLAPTCWWLNQQNIILNMDCHYVILEADNNFSFFSLAFLPCASKAFRTRLGIIINNTHCASHIVKLIHFTFLTVIFPCELSIRFLCAARKYPRNNFSFLKNCLHRKCFDYFIEYAIVRQLQWNSIYL